MPTTTKRNKTTAAPKREDTGAARTPNIRTGTKQALLLDMLRSTAGATIAEISAATGWQQHSVRGVISGAVKKKLGLDVTSEIDEGRSRVYRLCGLRITDNMRSGRLCGVGRISAFRSTG